MVRTFLAIPLILVCLCASASATATQFEGLLEWNSEQAWLKGEDFRYPIQPLDEYVLQHLGRLESGDHLLLNGELLDDKLIVREIQFIGLRRLLGLWLSEDFSLIDIHSFSAATWYSPLMPLETLHREEIRYALAPEEGPGHLFFLVRRGSAITGRLQLIADDLLIEFFSPNGESQRTRLQRMSPRQ